MLVGHNWGAINAGKWEGIPVPQVAQAGKAIAIAPILPELQLVVHQQVCYQQRYRANKSGLPGWRHDDVLMLSRPARKSRVR